MVRAQEGVKMAETSNRGESLRLTLVDESHAAFSCVCVWGLDPPSSSLLAPHQVASARPRRCRCQGRPAFELGRLRPTARPLRRRLLPAQQVLTPSPEAILPLPPLRPCHHRSPCQPMGTPSRAPSGMRRGYSSGRTPRTSERMSRSTGGPTPLRPSSMGTAVRRRPNSVPST